MPVLDVFNSDAFSCQNLTESFNTLPYVPGRLGAMGLFQGQGISTTVAMIEKRDNMLALLPTAERGAPATIASGPKREVLTFKVPHIPYDDSVLAEALQDVRAFGSENELEGMTQVINNRLESMRQDHEVTAEHLRAGAIQGNILDADGTTVIYDLFTAFGITESVVDFEFTVATTDVRLLALTAKRAMEDALGAASYQQAHVMCSDGWFDAFISHDDVKDAYARWRDGEWLRSDPRAGFPFADCIWENYRGKVGSVDFIETDTARMFPIGTPSNFIERWAPADYVETVNTIGLPVYVKQELMKFGKGVDISTQSNPLPLCCRPGTLIKLTMS